MKKSAIGTSIIEALVVTLVITVGLVGMYNLYIKSNSTSRVTGNRVEAIQIAREGIEAVINIRDTNALIYEGDMKNCWNTLNYDNTCIGNTGTGKDIADGGSYTLYKDTDNRWKLNLVSGLAGGYVYTNPNYKTSFRVKRDANNFYTQAAGTDFLPIFTREIKFSYSGSIIPASNNDTLIVTSLVQWGDSSKSESYKVELKEVLTNWKGFE